MQAERILDASDPRVADYRHLREPRALERLGLFVVESRQCVQRGLAAGRFRLRSLLLGDAAFAALAETVSTVRSPPRVFVAALPLLKTIAGFDFHRGCVGLGERRADDDVDALLPADPRAATLLVALDRVSNPDNVGGIFRNAVAFGAAGVLLSPGSGDPLYRKAVRVSLGTTVTLPFAYANAWPDDLARLRRTGFRTIALTPEGDDVRQLDLGGATRLVLVVGSEGSGLAPGVRAACDATLSIPMASGIDSLNAGTAAGIALFHLAAAR